MKVPDIKVTPPGPKAREIVERDRTFVATTTKSASIVIRRASGSVVEDVDGNLLIDFASGLTYALEGGMQRIADKVFLLTPRNVEVSAEERARLIEKGFFNQS